VRICHFTAKISCFHRLCTPISHFCEPNGSVGHCSDATVDKLNVKLNKPKLIYVNAVIVKALECIV